ncbi:anthranilate phosphoribosyltransferase [Spirabiliibacterium falconis]|uniref:anthranilate phosphoribosyltransferase n=1 Tax=Spirabiliibacterium falconis TaxID=572023 RepID=UPI001AAD20BC|nr:anthranilate phosphoribosyltransferase [Spirabiliibacterium falconis]MBE2894072.1 anthranilate phosphoribosyltransferase [Spirabiliibacterium falconis]
MYTLLEQLYSGKHLTRTQSEQLFNAIVNGELTPEQLAGVLIAMRVRGESHDEIAGAVKALQNAALDFPRPDYPFADIVGTGGDGADTINISTASAIVGAHLGAKIAKHGNRSVSSKSGSSDVLSALGINIHMTPDQARSALDEIGLCFLFAQQYHTGFKHAMPVRNALKTRTIFNILGPLINPAKPARQLLGVYTPELIERYAQTALLMEHEHTIIVHGAGLDEVALHGETQVAEVKNGHIDYFTLTPADFGLAPQPLEHLKGGLPDENARMLTALLQGTGSPYHANAVAANTALLLRLFGHHDLKSTTATVLETLARGSAYATLQQLRNIA